MIALQQAESNRAHHVYTPYDIDYPHKSYGMARWLDGPMEELEVDEVEPYWGRSWADVTKGVTYKEYYDPDEWKVVVIEGAFADIVMDTDENIAVMRDHVKVVERYKREHPEKFVRCKRERSDDEEY